MRRGLEDIYREIKDVKSMQGVPSGPKETGRLLNEAADQLDEIMRTTEEATVRIMDIVEKHQEMIGKSGDLLKTFRTGGASKEAVDKLCDLQEMHERDLTEIMTTLSFQDLTGQRIKRIVEALKRIEEIVFNVYMSTGLIVKARDLEPEKDMEQLEEEAREKVTKLRGPQENGASQADVDDLLSSLGLE
jgi:chemotaxis protein CheZ